MTQYWEGTSHFFLLNLYNFKNIGGGSAPCPPYSVVPAKGFVTSQNFKILWTILQCGMFDLGISTVWLLCINKKEMSTILPFLCIVIDIISSLFADFP